MRERSPFRGQSALRKLLWPALALLLLVLFNGVFTKGFFRFTLAGAAGSSYLCGDIIDVLNYGTVVMVLALGMTLVIATGGVDLSVGSVMAIAGGLAAVLVRDRGWSAEAAMVAALAAGTVAGAWNGLLVSVLRIQPIVATLILMVAGRGIARLITGGQIIDFKKTAAFERLAFPGNGHLLYLPFEIWIAAIVLGVTVAWVRLTAAGLFIESVGDNETASGYAGVNDRLIKWLVYAYAGFCAGIAGVMAAGDIRAADPINTGSFIELDAILATVIGGTALTGGRFYLAGSALGALFIQMLTHTLVRQDVPPAVAPVPKAMVIVAVCLLQAPAFRRRIAGLFARRKGGGP